ncbi:MAG TPA: c-type cytochrome [Polyangiales bacterium]
MRALRFTAAPLALVGLTSLMLSATACGPEERAQGQWPLSKEELTRAAQPAEAGEATYRRYCVGCHGADGRGNGGRTGADFIASGAQLGQKPDSELATSVREGKRGEHAVMPAHKPVLNDAQISEVVGYVRKRFMRTDAPNPQSP